MIKRNETTSTLDYSHNKLVKLKPILISNVEMPLHGITIKLDRTRNVYHQGEHISGRLFLDNKYELKHDGVSISLDGFVDVSHSNFKSLNVMDTFKGGSTRTIPLVDFTYGLLRPGRLSPGETIVP